MGSKKVVEERFSSAGWVFFCITFVVLLGPGIYLSRKITYEDTRWLGIVGMGAILSAMAAGLATWALNSVLQYNASRKRLAEKRKVKKK